MCVLTIISFVSPKKQLLFCILMHALFTELGVNNKSFSLVSLKKRQFRVILFFILQLAEIARTQRNLEHQGNVAYHQFEYKLGYNHDGLIKDLRIPGLVR